MSGGAWAWVAVAVGLLLLFGLYLSMTAGRLDRLHRRVATAAAALDIQLLRRSAVAVELASTGVLDPATAVVMGDSAHRARMAAEDDAVARGLAESDLTRVLVLALPDEAEVADLREDPDAADLLDELAGACLRVQLSRRFHNDAVRACRQVRRQRAVRWLSLAGHTPWPQTLEMDDTPPPGLPPR